jgi:hypothetical protein
LLFIVIRGMGRDYYRADGPRVALVPTLVGMFG